METILKKKILFVITKSNFGGAQRYVYDLATNLPKDSFEVTVAFGGTGLLRDKLETAGIATRQIPSFQRDISFFKELKGAFELATLIRELHPDIIHLNSSKAGGTGAFVARILGVQKIIFTAHGWAFLENRSRLWKMLTWLLSLATGLLAHHVIVVSDNDLRNAPTKQVRKKCLRIYPGVSADIPFIERWSARAELFDKETLHAHESDVFVVSTSEHTHNKNLMVLLDAVAMHNAGTEQKVFLALMNDGELRQELQSHAHELGISDHVYFLGFINNATQYLQAFDVFVLPSLKEGFPYSLLEAGAAGLPTIASRVGGIPEIITDGIHGKLIDPRKTNTITEALLFFCRTPESRSRYGAALQNRVRDEFTQSTMLQETFASYEQ